MGADNIKSRVAVDILQHEHVKPRRRREDLGHREPALAEVLEDHEIRPTAGHQIRVTGAYQDQPLAYIDLEADGHIDHLFCRPEAAGQGLASALYAELEQSARNESMTYLYVEASESARPVFARLGFGVVRREDFEMSGVPMHNYAMEKYLTE